MSNSAKEMSECIAALTALVAAPRDDMTSVLVTLSRIESHLDNFVTKDEMHVEFHKQTSRIYGAMTALVAAVYFIARYIR